ncbi:PQQ-like domain-containing protein [Filimonas lacunae]|uniref:PQQ-like domain-containing protein n=1 Tax=Filimonas lacunae TaxID=477680 RepID=A0A173MFC7_9BACT|nr:PKD domain-containing protein [Filimonas lacunae]BAV06189.1 hypothetical protein FLA_2205 [Filimonas lacunae]SIT25192.1 PQQ-like domain-containing protein [Filimonas lacunae]
MKKKLPVIHYYFWAVLACVAGACSRKEIITVMQQPDACFVAKANTASYGSWYLTETYTHFIDSPFYFTSCYDSVTNAQWRWNLGDGTITETPKPVHSYAKRGNYTVSLVMKSDNLYDTVTKNVSVILGQQSVTLPGVSSLWAVAMEETTGYEWQVLARDEYATTYYLVQLDSLLKVKSKTLLPSGYVLPSMCLAADGNYIFPGTTSGAGYYNELLKLKADGTVLWRKTFSTNESYGYAAQTPDGGYGMVGNSVGTGPIYINDDYPTVIQKTDGDGNVQWKKVLDNEQMVQASDAVFGQDGVVVAGVKRKVNTNCSDCDSLLIVKLNNSGSVVWQNTVLWGLNTESLASVRILALTNGGYAVYNKSGQGIYLFSSTGEFTNRLLAPNRLTQVTNSGDGHLIALQMQSSNGFRMQLSKVSMEGETMWSIFPNGNQPSGNSSSCCADSWPITIRPLRNGGTIAVASTVNINNYSYSVTLLEFDDAGKLK